MTQKQMIRYMDLTDRKLQIITGAAGEWRPEWGMELLAINQELDEIRRDTGTADRQQDEGEVPVMLTIKEASQATGLSYDFLHKLCVRNQVVNVRAGSKYLINQRKLVEYLNTGRAE